MKAFILFIFILGCTLYSTAQDGGARDMKAITSKHTFNDLTSAKARLIYVDPYGNVKAIEDGTADQVLKTNGSGEYSFTSISNADNWTYQTLSGTTPTWNVSNGLNAKITLTGATTITMSNLVNGKGGYLVVYNGGSTSYYITFAGYSFLINRAVWKAGDQVYVSGSSKIDLLHWTYNGSEVLITGVLDLQ